MISGMISEGDSCGGRGDSQAVFVCLLLFGKLGFMVSGCILELCRLKFALKASLFEVEKNEIAKKAT